MKTELPTHDRFEDRLLRAILDDFEHLRTSAPPVGHNVSHLRAGAAVAVPAAAAVAALALAGTGAPLQHPSGQTAAPGLPRTTAGAVPFAANDASYVVSRTEEALSGTARYVLVTTSYAPSSQTGAPTVSRSWAVTGGSTVRNEVLGPTGSPVQGALITTTPKVTTVVNVNYQARTWSTRSEPTASVPGPAPLPQTPDQAAAALRSEVATGKASLVGPATVGGQQTIEIVVRSAEGAQRIWVDPASYLPVQVIGTAPGVGAHSRQADRTEFGWLPPTPGNLALVTAAATVPAGFTEVPAPPA